MSEYGRRNDCGATNRHHFNDCAYEGSTSRNNKSSLSDSAKWILLVGSIFFMALIPPLGVLLFFILIHF